MWPASTSDAMWLITGISLLATIANIKRMPVCFPIWIGTNFIWAIYDYQIGATAQASLGAIYVGLAIWGIWEWRKR